MLMDRSRRPFRVLTTVARPEEWLLYVKINSFKQDINSIDFHKFECPIEILYNIRTHEKAVQKTVQKRFREIFRQRES
jgi:hypothetical protein